MVAVKAEAMETLAKVRPLPLNDDLVNAQGLEYFHLSRAF
jgi:hypothetical protein